MPTFADAYRCLNAAQKRAVDTVEGPVMVLAGPGTGKTQVLAVRVANILQKTQATPANILCLTYSTAGATAMRERLRMLIGADAYRVTVSTVHGFCDGLIAQHPVLFEEWFVQKALSDVDRYRLLQQLIDRISGSSALINPKNPYCSMRDILGRISECKREGKSLGDLERVAAEYEALMERKSRPGTKADAKNRRQARKFREFVRLFADYQKALKEAGAYDYEDMILTVIAALRDEENTLRIRLQERYQYVLVDEAQDLNGAQWEVIRLLTEPVISLNEPNFFLVGDDDQAIYRFQGANMAHMLAFHERFPHAPIIVLTENYRSTQSILDAAGRLIAHNEERLIGKIHGLRKDLKAVTREQGSPPKLLRPVSDAAEPWLIADLVAERVAAGIPYGEIAVLVQKNDELRPIYDVLRARNIPVILHGKADLLSHPHVREVLAILRFAAQPDDDRWVHALACACFRCHPVDVSRLLFAARKGRKSVGDVLLDVGTLDLAFVARDALLRARDALLDLAQKSALRTVLQTVEAALRTSGFMEDIHAMDPVDLAVVEEFFRYVKQRCLRQPDLSLHAFLDDIALYANEEYGDVRLTYQLPHLISDGVQLMTAHQSKGLEFHTVILSAFREGCWDKRQHTSSLAVPEELLFGWESEQKRFEKHQDERRVAYVAMTRAKRELLMLCPHAISVGERERGVAPSEFFTEAGPLPEEDVRIAEPEKASVLLSGWDGKRDSSLEAYLRERLQDFALSATSLAHFLENPNTFLRVDLLGLPEELTEKALRGMGYGSAAHWALRKWGEANMAGQPFTQEDFLRAFAWHLRERNVLTERQRADLLALGQQLLPAYFAERLAASKACIYAVERDVRAYLRDPSDPHGKGIPLKGKIDRIDVASPTSGDAIIVDYKTGASRSVRDIRGGLDPGAVSRSKDGEHFRQLVFYALLLEQAEPLLSPQSFVLEYLGDRVEQPVSRAFTVTEQEKEDLRTVIRAVWTKILALDFTPL